MRQGLQEFLEELDQAGELHRIGVEVSPILEITEIAHRQARLDCRTRSKAATRFDPAHCDLGGRALLFENVAGCDFPLAINVFGSYRRMEMALGCADEHGFEGIASKIGDLLKPEPPSSITEMIRMAGKLKPLLKMPPKKARRVPCQEIIKRTDRGEVDLGRLPMLKCWPLDGDTEAVGHGPVDAAGTAAGNGRYITFAGMHTIHADDRNSRKPASHNIGMYRSQLVDSTHLAMHWHMHHDGAAHWRSWKRLGSRMPIAICLGGESVMPYGATAPLPPGMSELLMCGFLGGRGIPLAPAVTVPLRVPANCEIVIEGWVNVDAGFIGMEPGSGEPLGEGAVLEGPFGDHTGFYSLPDRYPIVEVTAITHRREAVFPATIVGLPPQEDYYIGKATERIFLPLLKTLVPDIVDYHLPMFGCFHNCAFIAISKSYPLQAHRVISAIWGAGQMAWTKYIVVVDESVDVHDNDAVIEAIARNCDFARDIQSVKGPLDILDHAAEELGAGGKLGLDATGRFKDESVGGHGAADPELADTDRLDECLERLREETSTIEGLSWISAPPPGLGRIVLAGIEGGSSADVGDVIRRIHDAAADDPIADLVICVDAGCTSTDLEQALFMMCADSDPGRDMTCTGHRIGIDGTTKQAGTDRHGRRVRPFPPILRMDQDTSDLVDSRWSEYGFEPVDSELDHGIRSPGDPTCTTTSASGDVQA